MPPKSATASRTQSARAPPCCTCLRGSEQTGLDVSTKEPGERRETRMVERMLRRAVDTVPALGTVPLQSIDPPLPGTRVVLNPRRVRMIFLDSLVVRMCLFCWNCFIGSSMRRSSWRHHWMLPATGGELRESGGLQRRAPGQLCASLGLVAFVRCALRSTGGMARAWQW